MIRVPWRIRKPIGDEWDSHEFWQLSVGVQTSRWRSDDQESHTVITGPAADASDVLTVGTEAE